MNLDELYFSQYTPEKLRFLGNGVKIKDLPHYKYLSGDKQCYLDYLKTTNNDFSKAERFEQLIASIKEFGLQIPIVVTGLDRNIIIDGNHRAAICLYYNIEPKFKIITPKEYIKTIIKNSYRFGTGKGKVPYQSIYYKNNLIYSGRRNDVSERMEYINVKGKSVFDIGCNYGQASFIAFEKGAKSVTGIDFNYKLIKTCLKLNALFGYDVKFEVMNFAEPQKICADVAFVFSIDLHIKNDNLLAENLRGFNEIYFETHEQRNVPKAIKKYFKLTQLTFGKRKLFYGRCIPNR